MKQKELTSQQNENYAKPLTKKRRIISLWESGDHDIWHIAKTLKSTPSYVASVLQDSGFISGYFDLFTSSIRIMNVYSEKFRRRLGFKDIETAQNSLNLIDETYKALEQMQDRAGQHHCMVAALTMYNRARAIGKIQEADVFRRWLIERLNLSRHSGIEFYNHTKGPH